MTVSTHGITPQFAKRNDDNYWKKLVSSEFDEKGTSSNGRNIAATILRLLRGDRAAVAPVPETHFQFNAIVQNQLPQSSRNIRAKFTAESVLASAALAQVVVPGTIPNLRSSGP